MRITCKILKKDQVTIKGKLQKTPYISRYGSKSSSSIEINGKFNSAENNHVLSSNSRGFCQT